MITFKDQDERRLWERVFTAMASCTVVRDKSMCAGWADFAVEECRKRIPERVKPEPTRMPGPHGTQPKAELPEARVHIPGYWVKDSR